MDENLRLHEKMDEAGSPPDRRSEDSLLNVLMETIRGLEAVRRCRHLHSGWVGGRRCMGEEPGRGGREEETQSGRGDGMLGPAEGEREDEEQQEKECRRKVLGVLRELSVFHSDQVTAWREALSVCSRMLAKSPPGGGDQQHPSTTECKVTTCSDSFTDTLLSVGEDVQNIVDKLETITDNLDEEILKSCAEEASAVEAERQEMGDTTASGQPGDDPHHLNANDPADCDSGHEQEDGPERPTPDAEQSSDSRFSSSDGIEVEETGTELAVKSQRRDIASPENQTDFLDETNENDEGKEKTSKEWITVGLTGQQEDSQSDVLDACLIRAPVGVAEVLRCEVANALSCLMVTGSEELLSRVIRVKLRDGAKFHYPVTVAVPYCARYRGNYRDVAVKVVDWERRASYITPVTTEGAYGGRRGSFAEVRVYSLGLFAVVSCLKRENYTVPTKGVSLKLPMDTRICLNYLPGSFTGPVLAQTMIQPLDAVLLAAVKSRSDACHSVVSTSPLLYLTHPSSQPLRRPLTVTVPCPPNPEKKRHTRGQGEGQAHRTRSVGASSPWDRPASDRRRILGVSVKSEEMSNELLTVLGSRDKQWSVLDKVPVRSQQNGLVSFELTENLDRLLVVRHLSPLQPCNLTTLAEELEESVCCHAVTVILQRRQDEPRTVMVAALPSRDLSWELSKLRAQGYGCLPEGSSEISMREGDQLLLRFSGNITSSGAQRDVPHERITFHSQRKNRLWVQLTEVDPFGNYSSPHYKGTVMFYKVTRGQLVWRGDRAEAMDMKLLGDPVCRLSLTLPKRVRTINRPIVARVKLCEEADSLSDSLLLWLSGELSEEEVALLVLSLRLRRSAAQLVKLRAGDSLSTQAFHVLAMWRRGLPAATHQPKASQLAHCLAKSGRPDLARELLLRQAAATRQGSLRQGSFKSRNQTDF